MSHDNVYNQPGATKIYLTVANQTDDILDDDMGPCKAAVSTDEKRWNYTDQNGVKRKCAYIGEALIIAESAANLPAISGYPIIWFDPVNGWLKFRKKSEDNDHNVYVISLSDPIPE
jgi:hypothetical protein